MASETTFSHSGLHYIEVRGPDAFHFYTHMESQVGIVSGQFNPKQPGPPTNENVACITLTYEQLGVALTWLRDRKAKCTHHSV